MQNKRFWLDTEFDSETGTLLSLALVTQDGPELYIANEPAVKEGLISSQWVMDNVVPIMDIEHAGPIWTSASEFTRLLKEYFAQFPDTAPYVIADWPTDFGYLSELLITGPGTMIDIPGLLMEVVRIDAYPNSNPKYVQHNALWDARALRDKMIMQENDNRALVYAERVFALAPELAVDMSRDSITAREARTLHVRHTLRTLFMVTQHAMTAQVEPLSNPAQTHAPVLSPNASAEQIDEFWRSLVSQLDAGWNWPRIWSAITSEVDEFNELSATEMFAGQALKSRAGGIPGLFEEDITIELTDSQKRMLGYSFEDRLARLMQWSERYGASV